MYDLETVVNHRLFKYKLLTCLKVSSNYLLTSFVKFEDLEWHFNDKISRLIDKDLYHKLDLP
jgi:hypothetical protein